MPRIYETIEDETLQVMFDIPRYVLMLISSPLVRFRILFTNKTESALCARENDIAMAIIELNKKNHILEDRLLALDLLFRRIKEQSTGIQYTRNVFNRLLSEIRQQRDKK